MLNQDWLEAGEGVTEITPPMGVELAGFHRAPGNERRVTGIRQAAHVRSYQIGPHAARRHGSAFRRPCRRVGFTLFGAPLLLFLLIVETQKERRTESQAAEKCGKAADKHRLQPDSSYWLLFPHATACDLIKDGKRILDHFYFDHLIGFDAPFDARPGRHFDRFCSHCCCRPK